jgi:hypothetical protein
MDKVGDIAEEDIEVMIDTNVTGLIAVYPSFDSADRIDDTSYPSRHEDT